MLLRAGTLPPLFLDPRIASHDFQTAGKKKGRRSAPSWCRVCCYFWVTVTCTCLTNP